MSRQEWDPLKRVSKQKWDQSALRVGWYSATALGQFSRQGLEFNQLAKFSLNFAAYTELRQARSLQS